MSEPCTLLYGYKRVTRPNLLTCWSPAVVRWTLKLMHRCWLATGRAFGMYKYCQNLSNSGKMSRLKTEWCVYVHVCVCVCVSNVGVPRVPQWAKDEAEDSSRRPAGSGTRHRRCRPKSRLWQSQSRSTSSSQYVHAAQLDWNCHPRSLWHSGQQQQQIVTASVYRYHFLPARHYASAGLCDSNVSIRPSVCLSVCPDVRPSHAGIVPSRAKAGSWSVHHLIAPSL